MPELVRLVDVCIGGKGDCQQSLGIDVDSPEADDTSDSSRFEALTEAVMAAFPNLSILALTLRDSQSADRNGWSACLRSGTDFIVAPRYEIADIVDRVGTGDSFTAGLIYGLAHYDDKAKALAFATAASCLKHAISGDFNRVSVAEVEKLMAGDATGRVQR
jgi:2-dehydro-3-deoxygluconokinase